MRPYYCTPPSSKRGSDTTVITGTCQWVGPRRPQPLATTQGPRHWHHASSLQCFPDYSCCSFLGHPLFCCRVRIASPTAHQSCSCCLCCTHCQPHCELHPSSRLCRAIGEALPSGRNPQMQGRRVRSIAPGSGPPGQPEGPWMRCRRYYGLVCPTPLLLFFSCCRHCV